MMGNVVSNRIRNARKALGISQVELAKSCDVTSQTVYKYEAGRVENIPLNTLERFAAVLGVSPAYLAGWTDATSGASKTDVQVKSPPPTKLAMLTWQRCTVLLSTLTRPLPLRNTPR